MFKDNNVEEGYPRPVSDFSLPPGGIDAVFTWAHNDRTYFFKDQLYWRYDDHTRRMDPGYPAQGPCGEVSPACWMMPCAGLMVSTRRGAMLSGMFFVCRWGLGTGFPEPLYTPHLCVCESSEGSRATPLWLCSLLVPCFSLPKRTGLPVFVCFPKSIHPSPQY